MTARKGRVMSRWQRSGRLTESQSRKWPGGLDPPTVPPDRDPVQPVPPIGARVRLTGAFLRSTGQIAGDEGQKVWRVLACACVLCAGGRFVAVDEPSVYAEPGEPRQRHIAAGNLEDLDRLQAWSKKMNDKALEREKPWTELYRLADLKVKRALLKHGRDSLEYMRAKRSREFLDETRARYERTISYEEVFGEGSDPERYMHIISPIDRARILTKSSMPEPGSIEDVMKP
jgi:hypothetical protein